MCFGRGKENHFVLFIFYHKIISAIGSKSFLLHPYLITSQLHLLASDKLENQLRG